MEQLFVVVRGQLTKNSEQGVTYWGVQKDKTYNFFFFSARNPLEADDWLRDIE
jgi:hypothetical protein